MQKLALCLILAALGSLYAAAQDATAPTDAAAMPGPVPQTAPLTLHHRDAPAKEVLADVVRQLGFPAAKFAPEAGQWPHLTIDAEKQPYWIAMTALADQLQRAAIIRPDGSVTELAGKPYPGARCITGPFLVVATGLHKELFSPSAEPQRGEIRMDVSLYAQPGTKVLATPPSIHPEKAVDELGHSLLIPMPARDEGARGSQVLVPQQLAQQMPLHGDGEPNAMTLLLKIPENPGQRIAQLHGNIPILIGSGETKISLIDFITPQPTARVSDGFTFRIDARKTAEKSWNVMVIVNLQAAAGGPRGAAARDPDLRTLTAGLSAQVFDDAGKPLQVGPNYNAIGRFTMILTEGDAGPPAKLVMTMPASLKQLDIPFDFSDLPMP